MKGVTKGVADRTVNEIRRELRRWAGVNMTPAQINAYLNGSPALKARLSRQEGNGLDTREREDILDLLSLKLTGEPWPIYGEGRAAFTRFLPKFRTACESQSIKLEPMEGRKRGRPKAGGKGVLV